MVSHQSVRKLNQCHLQHKWQVQQEITAQQAKHFRRLLAQKQQTIEQQKELADSLRDELSDSRNEQAKLVMQLRSQSDLQQTKDRICSMRVRIPKLLKLLRRDTELSQMGHDYRRRYAARLAGFRKTDQKLDHAMSYYYMRRMRGRLAFSNIDKMSFDLSHQASQMKRRQIRYAQDRQALLQADAKVRYTKRYKRELKSYHAGIMKLNDEISHYNQRLRSFKQKRREVSMSYKNRHIARKYRFYVKCRKQLAQRVHDVSAYWQPVLQEVAKRRIEIRHQIQKVIGERI